MDEKYVSSPALLLSWSPKMDLLAVSNIQGEVCYFGFFLQYDIFGVHLLYCIKVQFVSMEFDCILMTSTI